MKILTFLCLVFLSLIANAKVYITYVNGADVDDKGAVSQQLAFKESMSKYGVLGNDLVFLPRTVGQPTIESFQITPCQASLARLAFPDQNQIPSSDQYEYYFELLGKIYSERKEWCLTTFEYSAQLYLRTMGLANQILDTLNRGHSLVLVPYSQGNFYVEAALGWLRFNKKILNFNNIRIVNIGNVAPTSLNGFNVTSTGDSVVGAFPYHFPQVYIPCFDSCVAAASQFERDKKDPIGHFLALTYLSDSVKTLQTKTPFPSVIALHINRAISELSPRKAKTIRFDYVGSVAQKNSLLERFARLFINSSIAQSLNLEISTNSKFIARVEGDGFEGQEAISIEGSNCDLSTRTAFNGYFTQSCTSGSNSGTYSLRVFDSASNRPLFVPADYQMMRLNGPLPSPNAPTLSDLGSGSVRINWNTVSGASGYQVFRNGSQVANLGVTTQFDDSSVGQGVQACYRVRAVSGSTASSNSGETCITTAAAQCVNSWSGGYTSLNGQETTSGSCPSGQTGSITYRHTCGAGGVWGATTQTSTCATPPSGTPSAPVVAPPTSCANSWNGGSTAIGGTDTRSLSCASGQTGSITERRTCGSGGVWGTTTQTSTCATPPPATCNKSWSTGTVNVGSVETRSYSCPSGQTGTLTESHTCTAANTWSAVTTSGTCTAVRCTGATGTFAVEQVETTYQACSSGFTGQISSSRTCQANGSWGATTTSNACSAVTCGGSWSSSRFNVGAVEDRYLNSCPAGSSGQVREFHTCQANGSWTATAQSDNCTPILVTPTSLYASNIASGVQLTWNAASGATSYFLYRNGSQIATVNSPGTAFVDTNVSNGVNYCYAIAAYSTFSNPPSTSARSNQYCQTYTASAVIANPPNNVAASQVTSPQKGIRLNWNIPSGSPDSFQIYRRDRTGVFAVVNGTDVSFTDWSSFSHTSGASYCYYMRSVKGSFVSLNSNEACSIAPWIA